MCDTCGCKGAETFEADKYDVCLVCYDRPATTGSYERVVCDECETYRTGMGQSVGYTRVDCGSCGAGDILAIEMMRCSNCYDSMCSECPGEKQLCVGCDDGKNAETFEADHPKHSMRGKVRTMSGKPHSPRKLVKDKDISPKEAAKRMKLEAQMMEQPEETFYDEGRMLARAVFMPDMRDRDSFGLMDTEYMIHFGISPDELIDEMESGSKRYNQFSWGWGQEWDKLSSEYALNPDGDMNESYQDEDFYDQSGNYFEGEWVGRHPFQEYIPDTKEVAAWGVFGTIVGVSFVAYDWYMRNNKKNAETFEASEDCGEDADCPDGKVCVDGKCLPICKDDGDCASWQECRDDLHPTEKVCGEDKTDASGNPFTDILKRDDNNVGNPNDSPSQKDESYSTTTKAVIAVGIVGAIGIGIKVLGGMQDGGE